MEIERFKRMVARLEAESAASPARYQAKVALLALLGFAILALVLGVAGFGLLLLAGLAIAMLFNGTALILLLLKLGKLLLVLAIPLWFLVRSALKALFVRLPAPQGLPVTRADAPALFEALDGMRRRLRGPRVHQVLLVDEVNAAIVQRPLFGLIGWPRNHLLLGLQQRWAEVSAQAAAQPNAQRWLGDALDREGGVLDTHPTLRARLAALPGAAAALQEMPPPHTGVSAAEAWLGSLLPALRQQLQQAWTERIAEPWAERHQQARQQRERLAALRAQAALTDDEAFECLRLRARLEPVPELAAAVADFNAGHPDHAPALYLEGTLRLDAGDAAGLPLIERAMALDADAIKPGCERCHAFFAERRDGVQAEVYAERWRRRDTLERERAEQLGRLDPGHALAPAELDAATRQRVDELLAALGSFKPAAVYLVRRTLPADPSFPAYVLALEFGWWARRGRRPQQALDRAAAYEWPLPLMICLLERQPAGWQRRLRAVRGARRRCASLAR